MIHYLTDKRKTDSRVLYQQIFNDREKFVDYYFNERIQHNKVLVNNQNNQIVSMLHRNPYTLNMNGDKEKADYIYAVATRQEYRKKGYMAELMSRAIQDMYNKDIFLAYLIPEEYKVYLPFGFQYIYNSIQINYKVENICMDISKYRIYPVTAGNLNELITFSNIMIHQQKDVYIYRDIKYYKDVIKRLESEDGEIFLMYYENTLKGYCYLSKEEDVEITEFVCNVEDRDKFLSLLSEKFNFKHIKVSGILYPWNGCRYSKKIMARIINVMQIPRYLVSKEKFKITLQITDPIIKENNQIFTFKGDAAGCTVELTDEKPVLKMGIEELTQWLFNYVEYCNMPKVKRLNGVFINDIV